MGAVARKPKAKRFVPPTLAEVEAYCAERKSSVDPKAFFDYFTADPDRQWVDSKGNPVKNWKQKIITWENNEAPKTKKKWQTAAEYAAKPFNASEDDYVFPDKL